MKIPSSSGQALAEMLLCLPLLLLLAAGAVQFSLLFVTRVQFEHACGEAGRKFSAGLLEEKDLAQGISASMGDHGAWVVPGSLMVQRIQGNQKLPEGPKGQSKLEDPLLDRIALKTGSLVLDHGGGHWAANAKVRPPAFFRTLFPDGVPLKTEFYVLRHPWRGSP